MVKNCDAKKNLKVFYRGTVHNRKEVDGKKGKRNRNFIYPQETSYQT